MPRTTRWIGGSLVCALLASGCVFDWPNDEAAGVFACRSDVDCREGFQCIERRCELAVSRPHDAGGADAEGVDAVGGDVSSVVDATSPPDARPGDTGDAGPVVDGGCSETMCGADCVDLASSAQHCGRCNLDCAAGACRAGVCQPFDVYVADQRRPRAIVYDAAAPTPALYWGEHQSSGAVRRATLESLTSPGIAVVANVEYPHSLAVDDTNIYWSAFDRGAIYGDVFLRDKALDPGRPAQAVTPSSVRGPRGLTARAGGLYWNSNLALVIYRYDLMTRARVESMYQNLDNTVSAMASDEDGVYWLDSRGGVHGDTLRLDAQGADTFVVANQYSGGPTLWAGEGAAHLYWGEGRTVAEGSGRVLRVNKSLRGVEELSGPQVNASDRDPQSSVLSLVVDPAERYLYFTTGRADEDMSHSKLYRVDLTTKDQVELAGGAAGVRMSGVAVGDGLVFWTEVDYASNTRYVGRVRGLRSP